jgi:hypothetical protein
MNVMYGKEEKDSWFGSAVFLNGGLSNMTGTIVAALHVITWAASVTAAIGMLVYVGNEHEKETAYNALTTTKDNEKMLQVFFLILKIAMPVIVLLQWPFVKGQETVMITIVGILLLFCSFADLFFGSVLLALALESTRATYFSWVISSQVFACLGDAMIFCFYIVGMTSH